MARIAGQELQDKWKLDFALTRIYGLGWAKSKEIMASLKLSDTLRVGDVTAEDLSRLATKLDEYVIEGDLARTIRQDINRLRETGTYRGIRHSRGLPARGQRTKSNARTKRGKRKTVGAFKKDLIAAKAAPATK